MKRGLRSLLRVLTVFIFFLSLWTAYANVFSDDTALRAHAGDLARQFAGCGDKCKVTGMHGDRGMIEERIAYDIDGKGQVVVTCRRQLIAVGDYDCKATKAP